MVCSQCLSVRCCRDYGMSMWFFRKTLQSRTCHQLFSWFSNSWFIAWRLCLTMVLTFEYISMSLELQLVLKLRRRQSRGDLVLQGRIKTTFFCLSWLWHHGRHGLDLRLCRGAAILSAPPAPLAINNTTFINNIYIHLWQLPLIS